MTEESIEHSGILLAKIIYRQNLDNGIYFHTADEDLLQVGKHIHSAGKKIRAHRHLPVKIETYQPPQEVLYIEKGAVKVIFYSNEGAELASRVVHSGDILLLINGGHAFEMLDPTVMIEIKQGPYSPQSRKDFQVN